MSEQAAVNTTRCLCLYAAAALLALHAAPLSAQDGFSVAAARVSLAGEWRAELQYRDYQSGDWVGIPFTTTTAMIGDGVTQVRTSAYDDGPARGVVYITSVAMLAVDGATEYVGTFRADRPAEQKSYRLRLGNPATSGRFDSENWVLVSEADGTDDNRPAHIRETTTRSGGTVTTLKEVDFTDDDRTEWFSRNRTILRRLGV